MIIPGFIDSHIHIFPGSEFLSELNLMKIKDFETLKSSILTYIKHDESQSIIHGRAAHYQLFNSSRLPSRKQLDSIISDRPLLLVAPDGHTAWANTKALSDAKILEGRTLPEGNEVVLASDGLAEGMLKENEAMKALIIELIKEKASSLELFGEFDKEEPEKETKMCFIKTSVERFFLDNPRTSLETKGKATL